MNTVLETSMNRDTLRPTSAPTPTAQVVTLSELPAAGANSSATALIDNAHPLHGIKTQLQVCIGQATITVGELLGAREQKVMVLDRTPEQPVDLLLDGKVVARGQLVAVDGHFAVRITELPVALKLQQQT
jgi:flagellar motor switch protein FliN